VPVPPASAAGAGESLGDRPCPVCQDKLKSEWSDDEEEWVWWNAVVVDGVVRLQFLPLTPSGRQGERKADRHRWTVPQLYHATCHAEATQAQQALRSAAGTGTGTGTRALPSREGTPAAVAAAAMASKKRPAPEDDDAALAQAAAAGQQGVGEEGGAEPELKRVKSEPGLE